MAKNDPHTQSTSPPTGMGASPGLGDAFQLNLNTGQGVYSYKLALPKGVAGYGPGLSLEYSHGSRAGAFGHGWRLPVRTIDRRLTFGAEAGDVRETFLDGSTEIAELPDGSFAPVVETSFARFVRAGSGWEIHDRDGSVHQLGQTAGGRIADPDDPSRVIQWLLERSTDAFGNRVDYAWDVVEGMAYLREVGYAAYAVRLAYEDRPDVRLDGRAGFLRRLTRRCTGISLILDPTGPEARRTRSWTLGYDEDADSGVSLLTSIALRSFGAAVDGSQDVVRPPVRFGYGAFDATSHPASYLESEGSAPPSLLAPDVALLALDDAPLPGVLQNVGGRQYYWRNTGTGTLQGPRPLADAPFAGTFASAGVAMIDADGSGSADLALLDSSVPGYYENAGADGWGRFVGYPRANRAVPTWGSQRLRLGDVDADGRIDAVESTPRAFTVWRNLGEGGWADPTLAPHGTGSGAPDVDFSDPLVYLADMTGDGLPDLVRVRSGQVEYWPGLGNARFGPRQRMTGSPRLRDLSRDPRQLLLVDVDGDGCADLVRVGPAGVEIYVNRHGAGFAEAAVIDTVPPPIPGTVRVASASGSAGAGLIWNSYRGADVRYVQLDLGTQVAAYALTRVENGAGLVSELAYRSATEDFLRDRLDGQAWTTNFPFPLTVVASTKETDLVSGQVTEVQYRYHEAHYESHTRQFQGFRSADRVEIGDASRADTRTTYSFRMAAEREPGNGPEFSALNGMLERTEVFGVDGTPLADRPFRVERATTGLVPLGLTKDGRERVFPHVRSHVVADSERGDDLRREEKAYTYDGQGNVVVERRSGSGTKGGVAQPELVRTTTVEYAVSTTRHLLGKPARVVVRDGGGAIISETRHYYDGPDFTGLPLGQADRGAARREARLVLAETAFAAHYDGMDAAALGYRSGADADGTPARFIDAKRAAHDARGLLVAERDPVGFTQTYEFDGDGLFRTKVTEPLGETTYAWDRIAAQPALITYGDGSTASFVYDAQGRLTIALVGLEDPGDPPRVYAYDDSAIPNVRVTTVAQSQAAASSEILTYYSGHGEELQNRVEVEPGRYLVSLGRTFNPWGDPAQEVDPVFSASRVFAAIEEPAAPRRTISYDAMGRIVRVVNHTGGVSTAEYTPFSMSSFDANDMDHSAENVARGHAGTPRREEFDVFRQRTGVIEEGAGPAPLMRYTPDANGRVTRAEDAQGALFTAQWDLIGNRLQVDHRAAGVRRLWFDARGKVVRSVDAVGNDLAVELDERGRTRRVVKGGAAIETYTYDTLAQGAYGKLARVDYAAGSQSFQYDEAGRISRHDVTFAGVAQPRTIAFEYDALGREIATEHSDGTRLERTLLLNGWVGAIDGVLDDVDYDPRGVPSKLAFANGVTTEIAYTAGPPRVSNQRTTGPGGAVLEDVSYEYDALGLTLASEDVAPGGRGRIEHELDPLYQLASSTFTENGAAVTHECAYDNHVNLARLDEADSTFAYGDAAHPDRMTSITIGGAPAMPTAYDDNGNLLTLPGRTLEYNDKNELARVTTAAGLIAEYTYDHAGVRVSKSVDDGQGHTLTTQFIGRDVEIAGGVASYFVRLGDRRVAIISQGTTEFVHCDYAGSTSFFSSTAGTKIASIAYRPFGNLAATTGPVDRRTYSVHPFDVESGLYAMRRRYYAPEIGRFLTPDPLALHTPDKLMANPKALYPYVYVANDPLDNIDYDGQSFWSVVGAIVGVIAAIAVVVLTAGLAAVIGVVAAVAIGAILSVGLVTVGYLGASANAGSGLGEFFRGFMIGLNAGLNAAIATILFGPVVGVALGVIGFLAAFDSIAGNRVYQGILAWSNWLMPMSWLVTAVGLVFFVINVIVAGVTFQQWDAAKIDNIHIDWGTGTIVTTGGLIRPAGGATGFNMGNFVFLSPGSTAELHELGHTLNLAAYGWAFHYIGAIDENVPGGSGAGAISELMADSRDPARTDPSQWWDVWDPNHA